MEKKKKKKRKNNSTMHFNHAFQSTIEERGNKSKFRSRGASVVVSCRWRACIRGGIVVERVRTRGDATVVEASVRARATSGANIVIKLCELFYT